MTAWWGWGARPARVQAEADRLIAQLEKQLATSLPGSAAAPGETRSPVLPPTDARIVARLRDRLGAAAVSDDPLAIARHAVGQSYPELVRAQRGVVADPPVAVVTARSPAHVAETLVEARALGLAVVPFGGGTSVTGGVAGPETPHLTLSTRGLRSVRTVDSISLVATVDAGILGPELEATLGESGMTLGHFPQSFERSTVGGWIATRSSGQLSTGVGDIADLVVGLRAVAPEGRINLPAMPPSSEGPDVLELLLGSEGRFGIVTEASLRVRPAAEAAERGAWLFPGFAEGLGAMRALIQGGVLPDIVRLSDEAETAMLTGAPGALLVAGVEGTQDDVTSRAERVASLGRAGRSLGRAPADRWFETRYDAPYLRDALLERGLVADSLETATLWSNVLRVHAAVRGELAAALDPAGRAVVVCHVSHAYAVGASLYFTFVAPGGQDAEARWYAAKRAALDAMLASGGVVSHHHGIGRDHREWQERRLGPTAMKVIESAARALDPEGVLAANRATPSGDGR